MIPTFLPGVNLLALDFLLKKSGAKDISLVLSSDAVALKPSLSVVENFIVGESGGVISSDMVNALDVSSLNYSKALLIFQAAILESPETNVVIAIFDYKKAGFDNNALKSKYDQVVQAIQNRSVECKVNAVIKAVVSDQESMYTKFSKTIPDICLFDAVHLAKCLRNSLFNYMLLIDDSLLNLRHLFDLCLQNKKNLRCVALQDKMSVDHLCELLNLRSFIQERMFLDCDIFPCPIFSKITDRRLNATSIHFAIDSTFQFVVSEADKILFLSNHGYSKIKETITTSYKNITHVAKASSDCVVCIADENIVEFKKSKTKWKSEIIYPGKFKKCEFYNGNMICLTDNGKVVGLDVKMDDMDEKRKVVNIFSGDNFCVLYDKDCVFPFHAHERLLLPSDINASNILFIDSKLIVTRNKIYHWDSIETPIDLSRPIVTCRKFRNSICSVTVDGKLRIISPGAPLKNFLRSIEGFLSAFDCYSLEGSALENWDQIPPAERLIGLKETASKFLDVTLFSNTRNGPQLSASKSTVENLLVTIAAFKRYENVKHKYILTTQRTENSFRRLRLYTQSIPSLSQAIFFYTRELQNEILKHESLHNLLSGRPIITISTTEKKKMNDFVTAWGTPVRQKSVRTAAAPTGTIPLNTYFYTRKETIWVPKNVVIPVKGGDQKIWMAKTLAPIYQNSVSYDNKFNTFNMDKISK